VEVSQYNHLCQVFVNTRCSCLKVFNSKFSSVSCHSFKLLYMYVLAYFLFVDIPVDKHRCLLRSIALGFSH